MMSMKQTFKMILLCLICLFAATYTCSAECISGNCLNGYGTYTHVNGSKYEGYWKNDMQDGHGAEIWSDGAKYTGNYMEGRKHGYGIYEWIDASKYEGNWNENTIEGFVSPTFHKLIGHLHLARWKKVRRLLEG